jgi:hypothetical protein
MPTVSSPDITQENLVETQLSGKGVCYEDHPSDLKHREASRHSLIDCCLPTHPTEQKSFPANSSPSQNTVNVQRQVDVDIQSQPTGSDDGRSIYPPAKASSNPLESEIGDETDKGEGVESHDTHPQTEPIGAPTNSCPPFNAQPAPSQPTGIDDYRQLYPLGPDPTTLAMANIHPLDSTIRFTEETHKYQVDFSGEGFESHDIISVSGLVHNYFPVFDPDDAIQKMMKGRNWNPGNQYFQLTPTEIKDLWKANANTASTRGTWLHGQLERYMNGFPLRTMPYAHLVPLQQFFKWEQTYFTNQLVPFRTEIRFRSDSDLRLTGTADLLAVDPSHPAPANCGGVLTLHIIDWKFSKEIKMTNTFQRGLGPCSGLPDCNFSHYTLQQNLYKWLLETKYNHWTWRGHSYTSVRVASMKLAVFHESHGDTGLYLDVPCISAVVHQTLADRRRVVALLQPARSDQQPVNAEEIPVFLCQTCMRVVDGTSRCSCCGSGLSMCSLKRSPYDSSPLADRYVVPPVSRKGQMNCKKQYS